LLKVQRLLYANAHGLDKDSLACVTKKEPVEGRWKRSPRSRQSYSALSAHQRAYAAGELGCLWLRSCVPARQRGCQYCPRQQEPSAN